MLTRLSAGSRPSGSAVLLKRCLAPNRLKKNVSKDKSKAAKKGVTAVEEGDGAESEIADGAATAIQDALDCRDHEKYASEKQNFELHAQEEEKSYQMRRAAVRHSVPPIS